MKFSFITGIILLALLGCKPKHLVVATSKTQPPPPVVAPAADEKKIIFLSFNATRDTVHNVTTLELLDKKEVSGYVKPGDKPHASPTYLQLLFYRDSTVVLKQKMDHPLFIRAEYLASDQQSLQTKNVALTKAQFTVRCNNDIHANHLVIWESINNSPLKEIGQFDL